MAPYTLKPGRLADIVTRLVQPSPSPHRSGPRYRNINLFPIDYACLPRLRGRLTLRRLAWRRKPWAFGVRVFHPHYRYSCQHSHFRYLQHAFQHAFAGLRNAPLPRIGIRGSLRIRSFGTQLEPRYIFRAGRLDQ
jgi:hypothetical protein